ncbi:MAG: tetratricopeptide (TPR) repeat protein [Paraglaciecola sp.]|jgi:tetratricopeptide (TPR) repeat protein
MPERKIKIAIVEDNGMARINLRNHLLEMGFEDIACFSNGRELKAHIRLKKVDLLLMDFHLGQHKNGVEVIEEAQTDGLIKNSTSIIFITSDRLPVIVGQIVDVYPDALIVKPYTINSIRKNVSRCLVLRQFMMPIDSGDHEQALITLDEILSKNVSPRKNSALVKLRARILIKLGRYSEASIVYQTILNSSNKIIWARWGLIQSYHLNGQVEKSGALLLEMTDSRLTKDKACEWLARICIDSNQYGQAEHYMEKIPEGELSLHAARLKAYIYQAQERGSAATELLEKKRESNRGIRERFDELSLDLARCYLNEAEGRAANKRRERLQVIKFLIGSVGRKVVDPQLTIKKDYMYAIAALLEGDLDKANDILARPGMDELQETDLPTMTDAVNAWQASGNKVKATEILKISQQKLLTTSDSNEKTISAMLIAKGEESIGEKKPEALTYNKQGLEKYVQKDYPQATHYFYQAYLLFPREIAFSLNLIQVMVDGKLTNYETISTRSFLKELHRRELSSSNQKRLDVISAKTSDDQATFGEQRDPPPAE